MNRIKARFSISDFRKLQRADSDLEAEYFIHKKLKVSQNLAQQILKANPICCEDFLKVPELYRDRKLLKRVIETSAGESAFRYTSLIIESNTITIKDGIVAESRTLINDRKDKIQQVALRDSYGDFCCANLKLDGSLDFSTLHFLGIRVPFLWMLNTNQKGQYHMRLHSISQKDLKSILEGQIPDHSPSQANVIKALSGLTMALQNFTASSGDRHLYSLGYDPLAEDLVDPPTTDIPVDSDVPEKDCTGSNGCGSESSEILGVSIPEIPVPEFTFHECCNQHDKAYCKGCSECERVKADNKFFECMLRSTKELDGKILAAIYYLAVRTFGVVAFSHCSDRKGIAGIASAVVSIAAGVAMGIMAFDALISGLAALGIGVVGTAASMWLLTKVLCLPCELIDDKLKEVLEDVQEFEEKIRQRIRKENKKCKKKKGWLKKLKCRIRKVLSLIIIWLMIVVTLIILTIIITPIRILICGGLNR